MDKGVSALTGAGVGAGLMYILDPAFGRRRRKVAASKMVSLAHSSEAGLGKALRDLGNRARGLAATTRRALDREPVSDDVLVARVAARLGRYVSHPHALGITAEGGRVTLAGPILARELAAALRAVRRTRGVREVESRLEVHESAAGVPALQGGERRPGRRFEYWQENWTPGARLVAGAAGAGLAAWGALRRGALGATAGGLGVSLLTRSLANRSLARLAGRRAAGHVAEVHKTINIAAPVERVFALWTRYENFPRFMSGVREVRDHGDGRSHWVVEGPLGTPVTWEAEITRYVPNQVLAWKSLPGSGIRNAGIIRFAPSAEGGTQVDILFSYDPPAGALGHVAARLFGADPKSRMDEDLLRMKTFVETGTPPHDAAAPLGTIR